MSDRQSDGFSRSAPLHIETTDCPDSTFAGAAHVKNCDTPTPLLGGGGTVAATRFSPPMEAVRGRDWWFNEYLTLLPTKRTVAARLLPLFLVGENRKRKRSRQSYLALLSISCTVIANALKADKFAPSHSVHYSRNAHTYYDDLKGLYYPEFMSSKVLRKLADRMGLNGWVTLCNGKAVKPKGGRSCSLKHPLRSTYRATDKLLLACQQLGISHETTFVQPAAPVLILRDKDKHSVFYDRGEHRAEIIAVHNVNRFLSRQRLTINLTALDLSKIQAEAETNEDLEDEDRSLDLTRTRLRRIFNNSDWMQGGRFYGGWWQSIPSEWRNYILINGNPTVELDYHGFLVRAIYHSQHKTLIGDPYDIPTIRALVEKNGDRWEDIRRSIKRATQALIYAKPTHQLETSPNLRFPKYLGPSSVLEAIEAHHAEIKDQFRSKTGMLITNRESCICQRILTEGIKGGIPLLPIHDSYVVEERHAGWLHEQMVESYRREFGADPEVRTKTRTTEERPEEQQSLHLVSSPTATPSCVAPVREVPPTESLDASNCLAEEDFLKAPFESVRDLERRIHGLPQFAAILDLLGRVEPQ